jgi:hypothetical protein
MHLKLYTAFVTRMRVMPRAFASYDRDAAREVPFLTKDLQGGRGGEGRGRTAPIFTP